MKRKSVLLTGALLLCAVSAPLPAQPGTASQTLGTEKKIYEINRIEVKNFQDESLGRIIDLGIDLVNGRIVEVLLVTDSSLQIGNKVVAVPPSALFPDQFNEVYRLNVSQEVMRTAPAIDFSKWVDSGRSDRVAAAYRLFGQVPYFLEEGATASSTNKRPKVALGYVERSSKILDLPVGNHQGLSFGKVWSLGLDIPKGRILSVVILAPGSARTRSLVPAMALSFNASRDALLIDNTRTEFDDEPRYVLTEAANGQKAYSREESYEGPHTSVALEQGKSYLDVDRTVRINQDIRAVKINARGVQVGTLNGRVTVRGWVDTNNDKQRVGEIAIAASRLEPVDNQLLVGKPASAQ
jgi:osmotically-inducible protein OsmY/sporulation protein YlmC with PRC-barrel domain